MIIIIIIIIITGATGARGDRGYAGTNGNAGRTGATGQYGSDGSRGGPGSTGSTGLILVFIDVSILSFNLHLLIFFRILSYSHMSSMFVMRRLHLPQSCTSSPDGSLSDESFLMLSIHLHVGLPLRLFPRTSITVTLLPTYSSSLLNTCSYHFILSFHLHVYNTVILLLLKMQFLCF